MRIPDPLPDNWENKQPNECHITSRDVLIDDVPLPGHIAEGGTSVTGGGRRPDGTLDLTTVTVTLLVGSVEIDDEVIRKVEVHLPRELPER